MEAAHGDSADRVEQVNAVAKGFDFFAASDIGRVRRANEDAFMVNVELPLFLVADGMGGHPGGRQAAEIVVEELPVLIETGLEKLRSQSPRAIRALLKRVLKTVSRHTRLEGDMGTGFKEMGATMVLALIRDGRLFMANVGDSRGYLYRKGRLKQLSVDHSVVQELLQQGLVTPEQAAVHPMRPFVTQYVGMETAPRPCVRSRQLLRGDRVLLCSDGLTDLIPDHALATILTHGTDPEAITRELIHQANDAGGNDNSTVIVFDWFGSAQAGQGKLPAADDLPNQHSPTCSPGTPTA